MALPRLPEKAHYQGWWIPVLLWAAGEPAHDRVRAAFLQ